MVSILKEAIQLESSDKGSTEICKTLLKVSNDKPADAKLCPTSFGSLSDINGFHLNGYDKSI